MNPETSHNEIRLTPKNADRLCGLPVVWYYNAHVFRDLLAERIRGSAAVLPWHLPFDAPQFYRDSLTAEERVFQDTTLRGRPVRRSVWRPKQYVDERGHTHVRRDNHWFDIETQILALTTIFGWFRPAPSRPVRYGVVGKIGMK